MQENKYKLTQSLTTIIAIFAVIFIILINLKKSLLNILIWVGVLIIFWGVIFFGTKIVQQRNLLEQEKQDETKLPKASGPDILKEIIRKKIGTFEYWNHIKRFGKVNPISAGKNLIYEFNIEDRKSVV